MTLYNRLMIVATLLAFLGSASLLAQERTSAIIQNLVGEIAIELNRFEKKQQSRSSESERLEEALADTRQKLARAEDSAIKEELKAKVLKLLADFNASERDVIETGLRTLDRIVPTIQKLRGHLLQLHDGHGQGVQPELGLRDKLQHFLKTTAIAVENVNRRLKNPHNADILRDIEEKLVSEYLLGSEEFGAEQSTKELAEAMEYLGAVYIDLLQARRFLQSERERFAGLAVTGVVDMVALKISAALDSNDISRLAKTARDGIDRRRRLWESLKNEGIPLPRRRGSPRSPADAEILRRLRETP